MKCYLAALILTFINQFAISADLSKAVVQFRAVANPGFLTVEGAGVGVDGVVGDAMGEVSFDLRKLKDTHLSMRDAHTQEDLHTKEHPIASMKWAPGKQAELTLNGVTKPVQLWQDGKVYKFDVVLSQFGLVGRKHAGVGIGDKAEVTVTVP